MKDFKISNWFQLASRQTRAKHVSWKTCHQLSYAGKLKKESLHPPGSSANRKYEIPHSAHLPAHRILSKETARGWCLEEAAGERWGTCCSAWCLLLPLSSPKMQIFFRRKTRHKRGRDMISPWQRPSIWQISWELWSDLDLLVYTYLHWWKGRLWCHYLQ